MENSSVHIGFFRPTANKGRVACFRSMSIQFTVCSMSPPASMGGAHRASRHDFIPAWTDCHVVDLSGRSAQGSHKYVVWALFLSPSNICCVGSHVRLPEAGRSGGGTDRLTANTSLQISGKSPANFCGLGRSDCRGRTCSAFLQGCIDR